MPEVKSHAPGSFCWIELATSDPDGAKKFYSGLFGWEAQDTPAGPDMIYTMLTIRGLDVGAMYKLGEEEKKHGVPPHWNSYVAVESVDETARKAAALGGTVLVEPFDVMEHGRMAVLQDPLGAAICAWQPKAHIGFRLVGETATFGWDELWTTDTKKAAAFYTGLFGWKTKESVMAQSGGAYTEWINGGQSIGGMLEITPEMGPVPPNWLPYFMVDNCNASADKATALGGKLFVPPTDIPTVGRFSVIQDPQGATFCIIKLEMTEDHKAS
jgi:predicted enzyme related to lactoylglutathione lyase